mmetsp:Transcript_73766/g.196639  ORF Transcript_73766/g.196639 Transcript_73766/m.196639 type:complete len:252 (+) Transcript_73766:837-1592(+)
MGDVARTFPSLPQSHHIDTPLQAHGTIQWDHQLAHTQLGFIFEPLRSQHPCLPESELLVEEAPVEEGVIVRPEQQHINAPALAHVPWCHLDLNLLELPQHLNRMRIGSGLPPRLFQPEDTVYQCVRGAGHTRQQACPLPERIAQDLLARRSRQRPLLVRSPVQRRPHILVHIIVHPLRVAPAPSIRPLCLVLHYAQERQRPGVHRLAAHHSINVVAPVDRELTADGVAHIGVVAQGVMRGYSLSVLVDGVG